jgi:excisionase family DNA binding protein
MEKYYTTTEVAKMMRVSRVAVFYWIREKRLKAYKFGRNYRIPVDEFEKFKEKSKVV